MSGQDAAERLLAIEEAREARRKRRNRWLIVLLVVAVLATVYVIVGVSSQRAAYDELEDRLRYGELYQRREGRRRTWDS